MSTLTYSIFQALLLLRRMYVTFWGIVSASHPPDNQILHPSRHSLINWISDTLSQGYTSLQSLVKCLDHRNIVSDTVCSQAKVVLGCAMH